MTSESIGLLLGGLLPAIFFALSSIFTKSSTDAGIGVAPFLALVGLAVLIGSSLCFLFIPDRAINLRSASYALISGFSWVAGTGLVALALSKYAAPISKIVPLYNMNTLIAVLIGLWIFSEWVGVNVVRLTIGAALVIIGGIIVSGA